MSRVSDPEQLFELLTSVTVVCRENPQVLALDHVTKMIDDYVDCCDAWDLPDAVKTRNIRLIKRVAASVNERAAQDGRNEFIWQYEEAEARAAAIGDLELLKSLRVWTATPFDAKVAIDAALSGNLPLLQWLHANEPALFHGYANLWAEHVAFDVAAERGCLETVQWLVETFQVTAWPLGPAALGGKLEVIKWLHQHANLDIAQLPQPVERFKRGIFFHCCRYFEECSKTNEKVPEAVVLRFGNGVNPVVLQPATDPMDWAARNGHFDVMQWLHANRSDGCSPAAINSAAKAGNMEMLLWLNVHFADQWTALAMDYAAKGGQLEVVKWIHNNRREGCTTNAMDWAAKKGYLDVVKWLHANRHEGCTVEAMNAASGKGRLEMVQWLDENRPEGCTSRAMDMAASNGHLEVVQWLHCNRTEGCTINAVDLAAGFGRLEMVKWLLANRTERGTSRAYSYAEAFSQHDVLHWLWRHNIRFPDHEQDA